MMGVAIDVVYFFLMIRRPPRSTLDRSSAASDVYKRQDKGRDNVGRFQIETVSGAIQVDRQQEDGVVAILLSLIHISEPTRPY